MNLPTAILDMLKCGVCGAQLSRGPVYLQHDGAALCGPCYTPKKKATRNVHYEALAQLHVFPCKYKDLGCENTVPFVQGGEVIPHEEMCEHRQWACPVLGSARCDWLGPRAGLLKHCEDKHQDRVLQSPCTLQHEIVSVAAGKIYHAVRYLERSDNAKNFFYKLDVERNDESISKKGEVAPQGCLAIQEDTSLSIDINSLLSMLGGFDGATFTLEVHRRVGEVCAGCGAQVTALVYRDTRGWVCVSCAPARRACNNQNQGCSHRDIENKCKVHELLFCLQCTKCFLCDKVVERGSLSTHRRSACLAVYKVGSTWQPILGAEHLCLVSGAAGIAVCQNRLNSRGFVLNVDIPVPSERLREFRCVVRVTQPAPGQVHIYTPDIVYDSHSDWQIYIKKTEFPSWDWVFDVSMDITKIID